MNAMEGNRALVYVHRMPVRWGDLDAINHLNGPIYFRYMEEARTVWFRQLDRFYPRDYRQQAFIVVHTECTFLKSIHYPSDVVIQVYCSPPGRSSLMTWYDFYVEGSEALHARGRAKMVFCEPQKARSTPIPEPLRAAIMRPAEGESCA